ncbi:MAG: transglutaminase family protein, partial [Verrucomicrobiota bacterium]
MFLPGAGWVGLDPTSGLFAGEGHIPLACTPEPSSAAPIAGALDECETTFDFDNYVTRIHEDPRVTKPYTTEEWQAIRQLGHQVDDRLVAGDTRLTMGGEPTFVSIDDMDGEEWNYTADSPFKRERAMDLLIRLQHAFTQGAIRWYGEGKWYPGESVPRWAYGCFWRKDDVPLWTHEELFADLSKDGESEIPDAERFGAAVAAKLNISDEFLLPGLEDADYYRWKASALPTDEIITETGESDSLERRILSSLHERGLEVPSGYVLPIYYDSSYGGWCGGKWEFRRGHLYLIPGSSPMGFRLPLDSLTLARPFEFVSQEFPFTREEAEPLAQDPLELVPNRRASVEDYQDYYR